MQWEWFGGIYPVNNMGPQGIEAWFCLQKNHRLYLHGASGFSHSEAIARVWGQVEGAHHMCPIFKKILTQI